MILLDVSPCLVGQTTSESNKTRTVVSVSKIASQRFKNRVDTTSVLREKPRKPKDAHSKAQDDASQPSPGGSPTGELGHGAWPWPRPPAGSPVSPFRRYSSTFCHVWIVKRPRNPTKQGPLCPYRR